MKPGSGRCHRGGQQAVQPAGDVDIPPVAPPGSRLPHPTRLGATIKMRSRRYRGERSFGMLCSVAELGWKPSGPDEVPILKKGEPGEPLPTSVDLAEWLSDESLVRQLRHLSDPIAPATKPMSFAALERLLPAPSRTATHRLFWPWAVLRERHPKPTTNVRAT